MNSTIDLKSLQSEMRNPHSLHIDTVTTLEVCRIINQEDQSVANSIVPCLPVTAQAIDALSGKASNGGRIIYVGAGTSGRLGVLDASELPPTYSAEPQQFVAIIAGGDKALRKAQEGAEDDVTVAIADLQDLKLDGSQDALIGIAASGRTPYVLSCLEYAKSIGCLTVAVSCCSPSKMSMAGNVDYMIEAVTGAEVVTGSTRMKAGSATKMVLNMLSTGVMIKLGKTYGNMMVDVRATNRKLEQRARNIIREVCGTDALPSDEQIDELLKECNGSVKLAVATLLMHRPVSVAAKLLQKESGVLALALNKNELSNGTPDTALTRSTVKRYVLCIDGGGSKCAATILDDQHNVGAGTSAGCNVSDGDFSYAIANIINAVRAAMQAFPVLRGRSLDQIEFSEALVGLAGFDRKPIADRAYEELKHHLKMSTGRKLRICTDVELVATIASQKAKCNNVIVLIAGTGSIAMAYRRTESKLERIGRRGGWGAMLGDDGSGFDIGRKGIRHALATIEADAGQSASSKSSERYDQLTEAIVDHFQKTRPALSRYDLLSSIISPTGKSSATDVKRNIADAAQTVLRISPTDPDAELIVNQSAADLAKLVQDLINAKIIEPSATVLAVTGGLMSSDLLRQKVLQHLDSAGGKFKHILHISHPSQEGAELLRSQI